ncbi:MAG: DUF4381 family protein [Pseudomonadota bacterium]|nr:DUF4381 family protein [Xanthomonadaceae bacterium]MDE2247805.1 DUF4381 family protein [Xanthomonadaceae bacterium]MDE3210102.1 DUF4381 family protein [Pseudomonadota bacterium]
MTLPATPVPASPGPSLRDIHLPAPPPWWPPAPGWWVLAGMLLIVVCAGLWWWQHRRRTRAGQRRVVLEFEQILHRHATDSAARFNALHQLLRRVARQHEPLAGQQRGEAWRLTLARVPIDATGLQQLLALDRLIYQPPCSGDEAATVDAMRAWLKLAVNPRRWKPAAREPSDG